MSAVTEWFPGDVKPVRAGWYQRKSEYGPAYWYWDEDKWESGGFQSLDRSYRCSRFAPEQNREWRGLAADPSKEKA